MEAAARTKIDEAMWTRENGYVRGRKGVSIIIAGGKIGKSRCAKRPSDGPANSQGSCRAPIHEAGAAGCCIILCACGRGTYPDIPPTSPPPPKNSTAVLTGQSG